MSKGPLIVQQRLEGGGIRINLSNKPTIDAPDDAVQHPKAERSTNPDPGNVRKRQIRPVSISQADPFEVSLNEWIGGACFSTYVKRLIWHDMQAGGAVLHGQAASSLPDPKDRYHDVMTSNLRPQKGGS